ncbi:hypothetical protein, variant 1 [Aphanomyces invadans]|uniref:F-box domain-containing protein n=1 Tax=Aphanomyces invadans TaxID=157072 RepID=A0A024TNL0_9STRA|nr:hypothetical protein, variant 1 [Aphanomyces invadans]ETV95226.1 hypothetical protein, variant 1 [Aphanomyces invadans]|eukprot:XP_008875927.1 hypothetical protein, variant 1 [Aphanomyces invadans]
MAAKDCSRHARGALAAHLYHQAGSMFNFVYKNRPPEVSSVLDAGSISPLPLAMSLRRLGDAPLAQVIDSLTMDDVAMLMFVNHKFHTLVLRSLEGKCKLSCVLEHLPALLVAHRFQAPVPHTWVALYRTFACLNQFRWARCPIEMSNALTSQSIDRYEYTIDTTAQLLTRCGGHYRFEVWTLPISSIQLSRNDSDGAGGHDIPFTINIKGWTRLNVAGTEPTPRRHHSATWLPTKLVDQSLTRIRRLLIFGGHAERYPFQPFNDVAMCIENDACDFPTDVQGDSMTDIPFGVTWMMPEISGQAPFPRSGHVATLITRQAVAISGGSHGASPIPAFEIHLLHIDDDGFCSLRWSTPSCKTFCPRGRSFHSVFRLSSCSYVVFGGKQIGDTTGLYDAHQVAINIEENSCAWSHARLQGELPALRRGHSATSIGSKLLLVFGGELKECGSLDGTAYLFTAKRMLWRRIDAPGDCPCPRRGHAVQYSGTSVIVKGGFGSDHDKLPMSDAHMLVL